jgi:hypothetical protein
MPAINTTTKTTRHSRPMFSDTHGLMGAGE